MNLSPLNVTVVVCTRNRPSELERCLVSLDRLAPTAREVLVVNSAGDLSAKEIALQHSAQYVETEKAGVSHARNVGAAAATSEWIAYLDDDAVAERNWLAALFAPFVDPRVAAVFGHVEPLGPVNDIGQRYFDIAFRGARMDSLDRLNPDWFWLANTGHISMGTAMMLRRSVFNRWPGFDLRLGRGSIIPGAEEHLACFQLIELGYSCAYARDAVVQHPSLTSAAELRRFEIQMIQIASAYLAMLFKEYPPHRWEMVRRLVNRTLRGASKRTAQAMPSPSISQAKQVFAVLQGLRLCWKARSGLRLGSV